MISIYNDTGVGALSFAHTVLMCKALWPDIQQKHVKAHHIKKGILDAAHLLILPGVADRYYGRELGDTGNEAIRQFVHKGGTYLGICAGAYYAADHITWAAGTPDEIIEPRPLKFFPGDIIGPTYAPYNAHSLSGVRAASIHTTHGDISMYYNGGGYFTPTPAINTHIIGTYTDLNLPAIADCPVGNGRAVLSSVHLETDPTHLDHRKKAFSAIRYALIKSTPERLAFIRSMSLIS